MEKHPRMIDQTWKYHFMNAYHAGRSDRMFGKDKRIKKQQSKSDKVFMAIPAYLAGYTCGMESPEVDNTKPLERYKAWEATLDASS
jgi:hypothetical protein